MKILLCLVILAASLVAPRHLIIVMLKLVVCCRYGELQQPQLSSHMDAIQMPDVQSDDIDAVVPALQQTITQAMQVGLHQALLQHSAR